MLMRKRRLRVDARAGLHGFRLVLFAFNFLVGLVDFALNRPSPTRSFPYLFPIFIAAHGRSFPVLRQTPLRLVCSGRAKEPSPSNPIKSAFPMRLKSGGVYS